MKKISVIIPVYNQEEYLDQCVHSVLSQTMQPDEIILVDDGSTDSCPEKCDVYENEYSFIKVIHKKNEGLGKARNTGMMNAESEYIVFLDSDDYIERDMLQILYDASDNGKIDVVKCGYKRTDLSGKVLSVREYENDLAFNENEIWTEVIPRTLGSLPELHDSIEMGVTCALLRRTIIIENELLFPSEREWISEDLIFNLEYLPKVKSAKIIKYAGYFYRSNPKSLTVSFKDNRFSKSCKLYNRVNEIISSLKLHSDSELRWKKTFIIYLWMCILQEKNQKYYSSKNRIVNICNSKTVKNVLDSYPTKKLGYKQRLFVFFLRHSMKYALWGIAQCL